MEIILWIVGGIVVLAIAWVLLKLVAALAGLSLVLGTLTWLFFDSFWTGVIIGAIITVILIINDPDDFFDSAMEDPQPSRSSNSSSETIRMTFEDGSSEILEKNCEDASGFYDQYGHKWERQSDGTYMKRS